MRRAKLEFLPNELKAKVVDRLHVTDVLNCDLPRGIGQSLAFMDFLEMGLQFALIERT